MLPLDSCGAFFQDKFPRVPPVHYISRPLLFNHCVSIQSFCLLHPLPLWRNCLSNIRPPPELIFMSTLPRPATAESCVVALLKGAKHNFSHPVRGAAQVLSVSDQAADQARQGPDPQHCLTLPTRHRRQKLSILGARLHAGRHFDGCQTTLLSSPILPYSPCLINEAQSHHVTLTYP